MKKTAILSSILSIVLCVSMIAGGTYALFTSESKTDITVTSGKVEVSAMVDSFKMYSHENIDMTTYEGTKVDVDGTFLTGGTATYDNKTGNVKLDRLVPGDGVNFTLKLENKSNVAIKYRTVIAPKAGTDVELMKALKVTIGNSIYTGTRISSAWTTLEAGAAIDAAAATVDVNIELPTAAIDDYQGLTTELYVAIEAVQANATTFDPMTQAQADALLAKNDQHIVLDLVQDTTIDVDDVAKFGGDATESITINGNGNTLYLDNNRDDLRIVFGAKNPDVKIILKNVNVKALKNEDGTWDIHDIIFANAVEMNQVNFEHEIAINAIGKNSVLSNVTIDAHKGFDLYAMWIIAGSNVEISDSVITSSGGRAIKIDAEYQSDVQKSTLKITDTVIASVNKAAVLVDTPAGADITISNVDITNVKADDYFTVWVDSDAKEYMDKVTVKGAKMRYEDDLVIDTAEEMVAFEKSVNEGKNPYSGLTVYMTADIDLAGNEWTPIGQTGATQFLGTFDGQGFTISNMTIDTKDTLGQTNYSTGFFGWANNSIIRNVNFVNADVKGLRRVGVVAGYLELGAQVINCHVSNSHVLSSHEGESNDNDDCGDKAGAIVGYMNSGCKVTGCSATDTTVTAGRDAGCIVGAGYVADVTGCTYKSVTVKSDGSDCKGGNINEDVVGRKM